jgi:hypothetical protein
VEVRQTPPRRDPEGFIGPCEEVTCSCCDHDRCYKNLYVQILMTWEHLIFTVIVVPCSTATGTPRSTSCSDTYHKMPCGQATVSLPVISDK